LLEKGSDNTGEKFNEPKEITAKIAVIYNVS
jgi:hypothetical protein